MQILERDGFTEAQIKLALHYPHRRIDFRYELLDKDGVKKADLYNVLSAEVSHKALATIKRTARFTLRDEENINYLQDRIRPIARVFVPPGRVFPNYFAFYSQQFAALIEEAKIAITSGWAEFSLGEFLLSSPTRTEDNGQIIRDVEAYDGLVILNDDKFDADYTVAAGTNYVQAIIDILSSAGITKYNLQETDKTLSNDIVFSIGTEKLLAINELLRSINYESIHVDVNGYFTSAYYRSPADRASEYDYFTNSESVIFGGFSEELDTFELANKWVIKADNGESVPLVSVHTNDNPESELSTTSRGRNIVDYREINDVADQETLDAYTQRIAYESTQVYGKVIFETGLMPMHDYFDVFNVYFNDLNISGKYSETSWTMPLSVGAKMKHEIRRTEILV